LTRPWLTMRYDALGDSRVAVRHSERPALPRALRIPLAVAAVPSIAVIVVMGTLYAGQSTGSRLDQWLGPLFRDTASGPAGHALAWSVGTTTDRLPAALIVFALVVLCLSLRRRRLAVLTVVGPALIGVVTVVLKHLVGRTIHGENLAFPSGHTAQLTALAIVVGLLVVDTRGLETRASAPIIVLASASLAGAAMTWSSTALDVHYATDCLAGFCLALVLMPLAALLVDSVADRRG
jgi:membrane-associated phospholipid phosphatase